MKREGLRLFLDDENTARRDCQVFIIPTVVWLTAGHVSTKSGMTRRSQRGCSAGSVCANLNYALCPSFRNPGQCIRTNELRKAHQAGSSAWFTARCKRNEVFGDAGELVLHSQSPALALIWTNEIAHTSQALQVACALSVSSTAGQGWIVNEHVTGRARSPDIRYDGLPNFRNY